jgi:hypothetical protein
LESGADYQSVNAVALSAGQLKSNNYKKTKLLIQRVKEPGLAFYLNKRRCNAYFG